VKRRSQILLIVMLLAAVPLAVIISAWRVYRHEIPSGTDFYPYWSPLDPIVMGPKLVSPDGSRVIQVMFNDAGAAHSGNHWTWLIVDKTLMGKSVIAEGYSNASVRRGEAPFPSRWLNNETISVDFVKGRYDSTSHKEIVVRMH
jgi:hypothetical protein